MVPIVIPMLRESKYFRAGICFDVLEKIYAYFS
jgi:hypothetical protein